MEAMGMDVRRRTVEDAYPVKGTGTWIDEEEIYIHKSPYVAGRWTVTDGKTGGEFCSGSSRRDAYRIAKSIGETLSKATYEEIRMKVLAKYGVK
jgi:hypothetical protein